MHLVGFIIRIYHDARSSEYQILQSSKSVLKWSGCDNGYKIVFQFRRNICVQFKWSLRFYTSEIEEYGQTQYGQTQYGQTQYVQTQYGQTQYGQTQYAQTQYEQTQYARSTDTVRTDTVWTDTANRRCSTSPYLNRQLPSVVLMSYLILKNQVLWVATPCRFVSSSRSYEGL